uniref:Phosphatidylinositol 4-phosphate 5-kinase n=1 Tax=Anthurium amnicola TaxID=1678845 RepID=A0A1D1YJ34_9ARAE
MKESWRGGGGAYICKITTSRELYDVGRVPVFFIVHKYLLLPGEGVWRCCWHLEKVLPNGDIYIGEFEGLLPQCKGKYKWLDGTIFDGEWERGRMSGKGKVCWPSGATYEGDFCGGFLHGSGALAGIDGSIYEGSWRMNIQHGLGTKRYCNSDIYEGSWREGLQEGLGRYIWNNGNTYIGSWKAGKMCGRGVMKWANGDLFDGFWLDGMKHGSGCYKSGDGSYYFGTWSRGLKDGRGFFYPYGSKHPGLTNWYDSLRFYDAQGVQLHETARYLSKLRSRRNISRKWPISSFLKCSGRISHRTTLDGLWVLGDSFSGIPSQNSSTGYSISSEDHDTTVYEREYAQGVLIIEWIQNSTCCLPAGINWLHMLQPKEARTPCKTIIKGDKSYYLMLNLQLGIRYTVGKITPVPMREVRSSDFGPRARIRMYFPRKGSQFTPPHYSVGFFWKDYCPMVFRNLREMFKLDAADYMMSVCDGDSLKELSSPGKSGSIFYLSQDERFVIKTLKKSELKILLKMLPDYYNHVGAYENTLITKFFGLHRITLKGGRKVRFVVMGNMFCTELRIHRRYDLKGSSQGRSTVRCKIDENTTLKDLDLPYVFYLEKSWHESLFKQISLDCMFLESQHIIDYSLLLGLHFRAPEYLKALQGYQDVVPNDCSSQTSGDMPPHADATIPSKGLLLVAHEPGSSGTTPGLHIRGSTLRASAVGDEEVDLLLPDAGRLRVQLGVNMPAQAKCELQCNECPGSNGINLTVYDVVLYFGIIDILQDYNMKKKIEHAFKSSKFDPMTISAIEPKLYAKRFVKFMEKVFPVQD